MSSWFLVLLGLVIAAVAGLLAWVILARVQAVKDLPPSTTSQSGGNPAQPPAPTWPPSSSSSHHDDTGTCSSAIDWAETGMCDATCGDPDGRMIILNQNPRPCPGTPAYKIIPCAGSDACRDHSVTLDCIPGVPDPDGWSPCPTCRKPDMQLPILQYQFVPPFREALPGGRSCQIEDIILSRPCTRGADGSALSSLPECEVDRDCVLSTTPSYTSPCSDVCGGFQTEVYAVTQAQSGHGQPCDWESIVRQVPCSDQAACDAIVKCNDIDWSAYEWSECSVPCGSGVQFRTRQTLGPNDECPLVQQRPCVGVSSTCPDNEHHPDCTPPSWDDVWTMCYMDCLGVSPLEQSKILPNDPDRCTISSTLLHEVCGDFSRDHCPASRDCVMSAWSSWGECNYDCDEQRPEGGVQQRSRRIIQHALTGGVKCSDLPTVDTRPCNNLEPVTYISLSSDQTYTLQPQCHPVDCELGEWSDITPCSETCGGGTKLQARSITTAPAQGGAPCEGPFTCTVACNTQACSGCELETWSSYEARHPDREPGGWTPCVGGYQVRGPRQLRGGGDATGCTVDPNVQDPSGIFQIQACDSNNDCPLGPGQHPSDPHAQVCSGHGTCHQGRCVCDAPWGGPSCAQQCPTHPDTGEMCSGHGTCSAEDGSTCVCDPGWSGVDCSTSVADALGYAFMYHNDATRRNEVCRIVMPGLCPVYYNPDGKSLVYMPVAALPYAANDDAWVTQDLQSVVPTAAQCTAISARAPGYAAVPGRAGTATYNTLLPGDATTLAWTPLEANVSSERHMTPDTSLADMRHVWQANANFPTAPAAVRLNVAAEAQQACPRMSTSLQYALQRDTATDGYAAPSAGLDSNDEVPVFEPVFTPATHVAAWTQAGVQPGSLTGPSGAPQKVDTDWFRGMEREQDALQYSRQQEVQRLPGSPTHDNTDIRLWHAV